jgi:hypothetical protein
VTDQAVSDADVAKAAAPEPAAAPTGRRSLKRETKIRLLVIGVWRLAGGSRFPHLLPDRVPHVCDDG